MMTQTMTTNLHDFTHGAPINIMAMRNQCVPLTMDQIRRVAPSAFATEAYHAMSGRYTFISTEQVITAMMSAGFQPMAASQSLTRIGDKREFAKHMICFRSLDTTGPQKVGDVFPEVVLVNGHDGSTTWNFMGGLFRLACSNGLIVADSLIGSVKVRHTGNVIEEAVRGSISIVEHMPEAIDAIARWKAIQLTGNDQLALAEAAHVLRFADSEGKTTTPIVPQQLLQARRRDDGGADLWSTFNRVQENVIQGGLHARKAGSYVRTTTRKVKGIDQDVRLNRALWTLGERMAEIRG